MANSGLLHNRGCAGTSERETERASQWQIQKDQCDAGTLTNTVAVCGYFHSVANIINEDGCSVTFVYLTVTSHHSFIHSHIEAAIFKDQLSNT